MELSFEDFFKKYKQALYYYLYRRINNKEVSEDITAETFYKLFLNWNNLNTDSELGLLAWIYTTGRNQAVDYFRKENKYMKINDDNLAGSSHEEMIEDIELDSDMQLINTALMKLAPEKREIIELRFKHDMKIKEIAEIVGKNEGAVKMILYRGLEELKDYL